MELKDRVGIVTGSGRGIGRSTALVFARQGADVTVVDIDGETAEQVATEVKAMGRQAIALQANLTDREAADRMVKQTLEAFGRVDILVNNVGWDTLRPFSKKPPELWQKIIDLNLMTTLYCTRAVIDSMTVQRYGKIVNIASDAGRFGSKYEAVYSATKGGVIAFTKAMARELAPYNINVNCVAPGITQTPLLEEIMKDPEVAQLLGSLEENVPLGRRGRPEDIAEAVSFLCSNRADYITGQTLSVNGGLCMND
ncbi:MAG: 3-oxoacyl-ACP reductase FabG [Candidatus Tectomicrobia bacterium]|uniref:3-oxoacyl-ACP reductase FabG n=1 Tax=Tectimicrobiota bacterium TaxID=2528274 RepID=A0A932FVZ3_UNCTE|nr:3-oxoacyl-ACP reductase FabG [Candidatus Tectomicrobia bacterium]